MHVEVGFQFTDRSWCPLERCQKAVHLRTGDRGTDGAISTWLERHGIEIVTCADAFEACAVALRQHEPPPDLALIGADWLAPGERAIIDYFRESWPGVVIVVHGSTTATSSLPAQPLTRVCRSAGEVQELLADSPDALLNRLRCAPRAQAPIDNDQRGQPKEAAADERRAGMKEAPLPQPTIPTGERPEPPVELTPSTAPRDSAATTTGKPAPPSRSVLTEEELAALLEDDER